MTRPTSVRVGPLTYKVRWKDAADVTMSESFGDCLPVEQIIYLCEDMKPDRLACSFLHEVAHALHFHYYADRREFSMEELANVAGYGMTMFWQQNPEVFEWWIGLVRGDVPTP